MTEVMGTLTQVVFSDEEIPGLWKVKSTISEEIVYPENELDFYSILDEYDVIVIDSLCDDSFFSLFPESYIPSEYLLHLGHTYRKVNGKDNTVRKPICVYPFKGDYSYIPLIVINTSIVNEREWEILEYNLKGYVHNKVLILFNSWGNSNNIQLRLDPTKVKSVTGLYFAPKDSLPF